MSLIGFKGTNHPQQVRVRGASDEIDERITPQWLFDDLDRRFHFSIDVAANAANAKCPIFFDLLSDGLSQIWAPHTVWCNPPYSNIPSWVSKAWAEFRLGATVVMLLPANRTEQPWWQNQVEPHRDGKGPLKTEFIARRINFGKPGNERGVYKSSTPFGLVLLIFEHS